MAKQNILREEGGTDLIALAKVIWKGRKTVIKTTLIFTCIGLFIAIFSQKEYTASTTFVPQTNEDAIGGNLGGLAAMAGINLGSMMSGSEISPDLYPKILNSIPFQKELLKTPLTIEGQIHKVTFEDYYTNVYGPGVLGYIKKFTIGLPGLLIKTLKGKSNNSFSSLNNQDLSDDKSSQLLKVTEEEFELIEQLRDQVVLEINDKEGFVTVSASMPEALASAQLTKKLEVLLQQYIINFKIQKSKEQLKFIEERFSEKEKKFKKQQEKLARFRDRNINTKSALAQTTLEQLQSEYDLAYSVYTELAKQLETQYIQVKENTPVFTILNPVNIPVEKSKPKRAFILIIWIFLGGVIGVGSLIGKWYFNSFQLNLNRNRGD